MKHVRLVAQAVFSCLLAVLIAPTFIFMNADSKRQRLNFDRLFPETILYNVVNECLILQHELNQSPVSTEMSQGQLVFFVDAAVGRLFHVFSQLKKVAEKKIDLHQEDVLYLQQVVKNLSIAYQRLIKTNMPARGVHGITLLQRIKQLLKRYDAKIGAGHQNAGSANMFDPIKHSNST